MKVIEPIRQLAVDLLRDREPKPLPADHRPISQQPFRLLGDLGRKSRGRINAARRRSAAATLTTA